MNRRLTATVAVSAIVLPLVLTTPAGARTNWVCIVPGEGPVTFVSAADRAHLGIETANGTAGQTFLARFGEICTVQSD